MTSEQAQEIVAIVEQRRSATKVAIRYTADGSVHVTVEYGKNTQSTHLITLTGTQR